MAFHSISECIVLQLGVACSLGLVPSRRIGLGYVGLGPCARQPETATLFAGMVSLWEQCFLSRAMELASSNFSTQGQSW
ncbi:hypothetical protein BDV41DRAFT_538633 [Aspergillus transmontanensis]|uniref:Secreted protein n=1 Tax=Aspergillus transmontanensis TaxID=1034304 RepID=A0A5N6VVV3_9EURO|nr:hypothetical protein BDV41DRAFT_538633 [Aspergillus transmontanensis]